jgi:hypothetical protein
MGKGGHDTHGKGMDGHDMHGKDGMPCGTGDGKSGMPCDKTAPADKAAPDATKKPN